MSLSSWWWIPDEAECYVPAEVTGVESDAITLTAHSAREGAVPRRGVQTTATALAENGFAIADPASLGEKTSNLVLLDDVNRATVLHTLRNRFANDEIYTHLGSILVALNPFKRMQRLYTPEMVQTHCSLRQKRLEVPPHVFAIASAAYFNVVEEGEDQSIIISGESGAGKTESTKLCLQYIAQVAGSAVSGGVEGSMHERIISASPLLEAFGNAKTLRNDNSSRFGKWMVIRFDDKYRIESCSNINYLLEKSRVTFQDQGERNFHIFYQLCDGASKVLLAQYSLGSTASYRYTNRSGCYTLGTARSEADAFAETAESISSLGLTSVEADGLYRVVAGVLHLGNVAFSPTPDGEGSKADPSEECHRATMAVCELFGLDPKRLEDALCRRTLGAGNSVYQVPLTVPQAQETRDALAKALYGSLFDWLVRRVNDAVRGPSCQTSDGNTGASVGVLDIFGFEIFESNSFEQLCINYANEMLQQHFNHNTFKLETAVYESEGIVDFVAVPFIDNQPVIDLIDARRTGLFAMLDEEGRVPRGSSLGYFHKIVAKHGPASSAPSEYFATSTKLGRCAFVLKHYAGPVTYDTTEFFEKNKDRLQADLFVLLTCCRNEFVRGLFGARVSPPADVREPDKPPYHGRRRHSAQQSDQKATLGHQFSGQLGSLMEALRATSPHYIRCVKTNSRKRPRIFDAPLVLSQLTCSGVFEAVKIRKAGYPFRRPHAQFFARFACLLMRGAVPKLGSVALAQLRCVVGGGEQCRKLVRMLCESPPGGGDVGLDLVGCRIGKSMVLYRAHEYRILSRARHEMRESVARKYLVPLVRGGLARALVRNVRRVGLLLSVALRTRELAKLDEAVRCAASLRRPGTGEAWKFPGLHEAVKARDRLMREREVMDGIIALSGVGARLDEPSQYARLKSLVAEADDLGVGSDVGADPEGYAAVVKARERLESDAHVKELMDARLDLDAAVARRDNHAIAAVLAIHSEQLSNVFGSSIIANAKDTLQKVEDMHTLVIPPLTAAMRAG